MNNNQINIYYINKLHYPAQVDFVKFIDYFDEREQARYFRFTAQKARINFTIGRILIKSLLAQYMHCHVSEINFIYSKSGKPCLRNSPDLHFSISHCNSAIVVAIAQRNIGIDAEDTVRAKKLYSTAEKYINVGVAQKIAKVDEFKAIELFSLHWTCLEAVVKLKDSTIFKERENFHLQHLDVSRNPLHIKAGVLSGWSLKPTPEFRISIVSENYFSDYRIREFTNIDELTSLTGVGLT